jgi:hypothetical protein
VPSLWGERCREANEWQSSHNKTVHRRAHHVGQCPQNTPLHGGNTSVRTVCGILAQKNAETLTTCLAGQQAQGEKSTNSQTPVEQPSEIHVFIKRYAKRKPRPFTDRHVGNPLNEGRGVGKPRVDEASGIEHAILPRGSRVYHRIQSDSHVVVPFVDVRELRRLSDVLVGNPVVIQQHNLVRLGFRDEYVRPVRNPLFRNALLTKGDSRQTARTECTGRTCSLAGTAQ